MKIKITVLLFILFIGILLTSCGAQTATQEIEVLTEVPVNKASMTQEPAVVVMEEPVVIETPTAAPTETPLSCVSLLAPENGADLPVTGKITFSWTSLNEAESYTLHIILPSGQTLSFETDQTFRDHYMEAFVSGGEYQWQVIVQSADGSNICVSEFFTFDKPAYERPKGTGGDKDGNDNGGNGGSDEGSSGDDEKPPHGSD